MSFRTHGSTPLLSKMHAVLEYQRNIEPNQSTFPSPTEQTGRHGSIPQVAELIVATNYVFFQNPSRK